MLAQQADAFIGIRVPEPIKKLWLERARQEQRSLSNWILRQLTEKEEPGPTHDGHRRKQRAV